MQKNRVVRAALLAVVLLVALVSGVASFGKLPDEVFSPRQLKHWAYQQFERPEVPTVKNAEWVKNPVDAFVLARLEAKALEPSPAADKVTLVRRAYFDLIGLPPTPEQVDAFLTDESPQAFTKVVDELLASSHYGERWGRHWLDLARYADSEGFKSDQTRPNAWRYRDYVIKSLNEDKPYDRFVREQVAGDELWPDSLEARLATAFNRHYPDEHNQVNLMQRRQEILHDLTATTGSVFMGLTMACAQCHDHKFDPILQADYYRLQAFFANTTAKDDIALSSHKEIESHQRQLAEWEAKTSDIRKEIDSLIEPKREEILHAFTVKYPQAVKDSINTDPDQRTPYQWLMYYKAKPFLDPESHLYQAPTRAAVGKLSDEEKKRYEKLNAELESFADLHPGELPLGIGMVDAGTNAPDMHIMSGGAYDAPKEQVQPGFLSIFDPGPAKITSPPGNQSTGRRTALAEWLVDEDNPLTSRVMANRIWHYHFGRGLVDSPSNFGLSGGVPSHPALLNWLASEFMDNGWSMKNMHRTIMTSNTYQQASLNREAAAGIDLENRLLWRFPRQRMEGEVIRDAALAVSGLMNPEMGGPSVFPVMPDGIQAWGGWSTSEEDADRNRRSIYVFVRRNTRYPMFQTFDMPDTHESCPSRDVTTTPLQALTMLNNEVVLEWAQGFAARLLLSAGSDLESQIDMAYRLAYSRSPSHAEMETAVGFVTQQRSIIAENAAQGGKLALPPMRPYNADPVEAAALVDFCHMILNANEFVYRN